MITQEYLNRFVGGHVIITSLQDVKNTKYWGIISSITLGVVGAHGSEKAVITILYREICEWNQDISDWKQCEVGSETISFSCFKLRVTTSLLMFDSEEYDLRITITKANFSRNKPFPQFINTA